MNKDNAAQFLPLVQALMNGETIQWIDSERKWRDCIDIGFLHPAENYRVKPKPRTAYQVYLDAIYPQHAPNGFRSTEQLDIGFAAVVAAVKSGELV